MMKFRSDGFFVIKRKDADLYSLPPGQPNSPGYSTNIADALRFSDIKDMKGHIVPGREVAHFVKR